MADNVAITAGSGTSIASDDISSVQYQRVKLIHGVDGTNDGDVAATNGLPVKGAYVSATLQNAVSATGDGSTMSVAGMGTVAFTVSGSFSATITFRGSSDSGGTWNTLNVWRSVGAVTPFGSATGTGVYFAQCAGLNLVQAQVVWSSGTSVTVTALAVPAGSNAPVTNLGYLLSTQIDANSGNKSNGTLRVVLATDQPTLTNAQPVTLATAIQKADDAGFTVGTDSVVMAGAQAVAHGSNPDAADALDAVATITNRHRIPFMIGGHPNVVTIKHTSITTAVTDAAIVTVSTGTKIVVTRVSYKLDNASTVFPTLLIGFGTANTPTTTGVLVADPGIAAGGGMTVGDGSGILGIGADNEDLRVTTTGNATGNGLYITVSYYTIES